MPEAATGARAPNWAAPIGWTTSDGSRSVPFVTGGLIG